MLIVSLLIADTYAGQGVNASLVIYKNAVQYVFLVPTYTISFPVYYK